MTLNSTCGQLTSYAGWIRDRSCSICFGSTWSTSWNWWSRWPAVIHRGHSNSLQSKQKYSNCLWCCLQRVREVRIEGRTVLLRCKASRATFLSSSETMSTNRFKLKLVFSSDAFPVVRWVTCLQLGHSRSSLFVSAFNLALIDMILSKQTLQNEWAHSRTLGSCRKSRQIAQINSSLILVLNVTFLAIATTS